MAETTERIKDGIDDRITEPVIRVTNGLLGLVIMIALVAAVGLADPLINFLNGDLANLGDLGTVSNGLGIGLGALLASFIRNEASYSEFTTIQRIFYAIGTGGFLAVFLSDTVNQAASSDPVIGVLVVSGGIVYHYSVSAADVLGAKLDR